MQPDFRFSDAKYILNQAVSSARPFDTTANNAAQKAPINYKSSPLASVLKTLRVEYNRMVVQPC